MSGYTSSASGRGRTFMQSIDSCLQNYIGFSGRAPRSEYWYWTLFAVLFGFAANFIFGLIGHALHIRAIGSLVGLAANLITFLPSIAVFVRRMHDVNRSGWWYFFALVPVIGIVMLLIWCCTRGTAGQNRYGPDPLSGY